MRCASHDVSVAAVYSPRVRVRAFGPGAGSLSLNAVHGEVEVHTDGAWQWVGAWVRC